MRKSSRLLAGCVLILLNLLCWAHTASAQPVCAITKISEGPPLSVEFTFRESRVGIKSIRVVEAVNASVNIPLFPPGFINPIVVTATKAAANGEFSVKLEAVDQKSRVTSCQYQQEGPIDEVPPTCEMTGLNPGPPFSVQFTIKDLGDGLDTVAVLSSVNANVNIPQFNEGTTSPVLVTATKIDEGGGFSLSLQAVDMGGRVSTCQYSEEVTDVEAPTCETVVVKPGPPSEINVIVRDTGSGLKSISVIDKINANVTIPSFSLGTKESVVIAVAQIVPVLDFSVAIECVDMNDNKATCRYPTSASLEVRPEFDAAGRDSDSFFSDFYKTQVIANGTDHLGRKINYYSAFGSEYFTTTAGSLAADACFSLPSKTYLSALTTAWSEAVYEWEITLQMKPAADLCLTVSACVLAEGGITLWEEARQTGLYKLPWAPNKQVFTPSANPTVTVRALPGPFAATGFPVSGFLMDARNVPGVQPVPMVDSPLTLQAILEESILLAFPQAGVINASGQAVYELNRGDRIKVTIRIPNNSTADISFGNDNVVLKYLGFVGTEYCSD